VSHNIFLVISAVLFIVTAALAATNFAPVPMSLFGSPLNLPLGGIVFGSYVLGLLTVVSAKGTTKAKEIKSDKLQVEWQRQDDKLEREKQSDKEKQLEAKIQTLEVALKSALDKNKKKTMEG